MWQDDWSEFPVYLFATAGFRRMRPDQREGCFVALEKTYRSRRVDAPGNSDVRLAFPETGARMAFGQFSATFQHTVQAVLDRQAAAHCTATVCQFFFRPSCVAVGVV